MSRLDPARLQRTTREIAAELAIDPAMAAELARARREFLGGAPIRPDTAADARFCEWFVTERDSDVLGDIPARVVGGVPTAVREALLDSVCGMFLVAAAGNEVRLRDLITDDDLSMPGDPRLALGDVVMGRLYPVDDGLVSPSPLVTVIRDGAALVEAVRRDLARADLARRLSQAEVEAVLHLSTPGAATRAARDESAEDATSASFVDADARDDASAEDVLPPEHYEARLAELLADADEVDVTAAEISRALAASPNSAGAVIGPLLEQLAFETAADLGVIHQTLVELWNAHRLARHTTKAAPHAEPTPPERDKLFQSDDSADVEGPGLGAAIARRLEQGDAAHEDVEKLFGDIESLLGADDDEDEDQDEGDDWNRPDGDLDPLITEFLWERDHAPGSAAATVLAAFLQQQGTLPVPGVYLEAITPNEIARFLLQTYLSTPPGQRAARVGATFAVLSEFFVWAEDTQEYALAATIETCRREVAEPLGRTARASLALSTATEVVAGRRAQVHRVLRIEAGEVEVVGDNDAPVWLDLPDAASLLRVGDILLAGLEPNGHGGAQVDGLAVVLPAGASALIE